MKPERFFVCSPDCASLESAPDLGESTKPCDCWNAEIKRLTGKLEFIEDQLPRAHKALDDREARLEAYAKQVTELNARIKELEEMNQAMHPENAPKDCWPVVVYLPTAQDRDDLIAACGREKPAMKAHAAVYRKR